MEQLVQQQQEQIAVLQALIAQAELGRGETAVVLQHRSGQATNYQS